MGSLIVVCGLIVLAVAAWRGYTLAREALGPVIREGEPTRSAIESARPVHARYRVRLFLRRVIAAVGWIVVALYGLFLAQAGAMTR
jgi:hypothetical protein